MDSDDSKNRDETECKYCNSLALIRILIKKLSATNHTIASAVKNHVQSVNLRNIHLTPFSGKI